MRNRSDHKNDLACFFASIKTLRLETTATNNQANAVHNDIRLCGIRKWDIQQGCSTSSLLKVQFPHNPISISCIGHSSTKGPSNQQDYSANLATARPISPQELAKTRYLIEFLDES
ncbi:hypothetical protein PanWU01x14_293310 [Parasponia andersonii]|uniref:Uncharacterized protein n=1 Tax=Parasponia andersonii TaxID=3476 RepID=A0A2P5AWQ8_PARAD|nr:hypothetical protein PanWU01x14_293310 [Parasponia andersonii]